jgi:tetratricopeptide (TPR) repeat protein
VLRRILLILPLLTAALAAGAAPEDPVALMLQARALQRRSGGDEPEKAAALYRKVVGLLPASGEAQLRLSEALAECGDLEKALQAAVKATELDPRSSEAWANLGMLHYLQGRTDSEAWKRALPALQRATTLLPSDVDLLMRQAEVAEACQEDVTAAETWLRLGRLRLAYVMQGKSLSDIAYERAALLGAKVKRSDFRREALLALCQRKNPDPGHLRMLEELAREQVELGFLGHAEEGFRLLATKVPEEPAIFENIALIQLRTSRYEEALSTLGQAEALRKSQGVSYYQAICQMNLGRFREAEARFRALLTAPLEDTEEFRTMRAQSRDLLASSLLLQGRPGDLLTFLQGQPDLTGNAGLLALRAQALLQTQDWKAARAVLRDGMKRFPGRGIFQGAALIPPKLFDEGWFRKAPSREALGQLELEAQATLWSDFRQWERSLQLIQRARKAGPVRDVELLLLQANVLEQLDRPQEAMAVLREGQKLAPDHAILQNNLGYLMLERGGDLEEAARLIQAALRQDASSGSTTDSWGWVLFRQGKYPESAEVLKKAVELSPFSPEIRKHYGETLLKLGRPEEALDQWERALAYVFPDRADLERRARELRLDIARRKTPPPDPDPDDDRDYRP